MPTNRERAEELATAIIAGRLCESFLKLAERLETALDEVESLERAACATYCDNRARHLETLSHDPARFRKAEADACAFAIRARSKVTP